MNKNIESFDWQNSWIEFVDSVASVYETGMTSEELTKHYIGFPIMWQGLIEEIRLDEEFYEHLFVGKIALGMPLHKTTLKSNSPFKARRLIINVPKEERDNWSQCSVGDKIKFQAHMDIFNSRKSSISVHEPSGEGSDRYSGDLRITVHKAKIIK